MKFAVIRNGSRPLRDAVAEGLIEACLSNGDRIAPPDDGIKYVLNLTDTDSPRAFRRRHQSVFVFSLVDTDGAHQNLKSICYSTLVRSFSNMMLCALPPERSGLDRPEIYFTTPEAGFYHIPFEPETVYRRIHPIASSHFATDNTFTTDLPQQYWEATPVVKSMQHYARELEMLGVLPTPFPLREILSEEALRHLYKMFGITGASYGNLSAREWIPELGETTFWMTGRGVNKAKLGKVGKDVLLVKGFDAASGTVLVSAPPEYDPRSRVSVDAVEHELIYRSFPAVGAIVHVHAWIDGVLCTRQNYPCGTRELAREVVRLLHQTDDPSRAAIGLKNHGLTITGQSLDEIFGRIRGKLLTEVKMFP